MMYPFVTPTMGEVEDHPIDTSENYRTTPQYKRPCRRHSIENVGAMNASSVNDLDGESVGADNASSVNDLDSESVGAENTEGNFSCMLVLEIFAAQHNSMFLVFLLLTYAFCIHRLFYLFRSSVFLYSYRALTVCTSVSHLSTNEIYFNLKFNICRRFDEYFIPSIGFPLNFVLFFISNSRIVRKRSP